VHYKKTYLKQVILRLDFSRLAALQAEQETPFTADLRTQYPEVTATPVTQFSLMVAPVGVNLGQQGAGWMRVHKAQDVARSVTLAPEFVAIEYGVEAYKHFDELRDQVGFVLGSFRKHFGAVPFTRIGLRYINEITLTEGAPLDWDGLINPSLVTAVKAGMHDGLRLARSAHQMVAIKDGISVVLNYGVNNPDFPNPVARRQFILDLDCYISSLVESGEAEQRIRDVNKLAEDVFENSIGDGLRDKMERVQ